MPKLVSFKGGMRLGGHPAHAMLVHFPLAFWILIFPLQAAGWWWGWGAAWRLAFWLNVAALAFALPAILSGTLDFAAMGSDPRAGKNTAIDVATRHLYLMIGAATVFLGESFARGGPSAPTGSRAILTLGLSLTGLLLLTAGAWHGGELVFRHGIGAGEEPRG